MISWTSHMRDSLTDTLTSVQCPQPTMSSRALSIKWLYIQRIKKKFRALLMYVMFALKDDLGGMVIATVSQSIRRFR